MKSGIEEVLDQHILLENTHPGYYAIISSANVTQLPYSYYLNGSVNRIVNGLSTVESERGFTVTSNADGSLTYKGTNNSSEKAYVGFTSDTWTLPAGSYVLSDGQAYCLTGAPISTDDFKVTVMARQYHVGGQIDYAVIADASDLEQRFFTTDYSKYNDYYVQLVIAPGYTSEGITVYPMLAQYEERTEDYEPALLTNIQIYGEESLTTYTRMTATKETYLSLPESDREILQHYICQQAPYNGLWTTVDFGDGTGIYYPNNDPHQLQYGEINTIGQMSLLYGGESSIVLVDRPLNETTLFVNYLQQLDNEDYTVYIAVREDGVAALTDYMQQFLKDLGVETQLTSTEDGRQTDYYCDSYYAVLNPGQPSVEASSATEPVTYSDMTRDGFHTVTMRSCGSGIEDNTASIKIDDVEYAMNRRGMNIVVYDNASGAVVDSVAFDTNRGLRCYRELQQSGTE